MSLERATRALGAATVGAVPPRTASSAGHREEGTASVELVAVVPFLLLAVLVAAQLGARRPGAVVGGRRGAGRGAGGAGRRRRDGGGAAGAAAVAARRGARSSDGGAVSVRVPVPRLLPGLPRLTVGARTRLEPGDG